MALVDRRIGWIFLAFLALLVVALARATYLGAVQGPSLQEAAASQQVTENIVPAARGTITDRNGVQLAISESADKIVADDMLIKHPLTVAQKLSPLLGRPVLTLLALLSRQHDGYVPLARLLPADRATKVLRLQINGISTVPQVKRVYPLDWTASQLLGSVHSDGLGAEGLEWQYNSQLQGVGGERRIVKDAIGQPIAINDVRPMRPGKTLKLTIDSAFQEEVEQVLAGVGAQYSPKGATAIAMNPDTGAIMALANWPRVNANDPSASPAWADSNLAVGQDFNYEPGSTFKAITVAGALQDGVVSPDTQIPVPSVLQVADRQIHDAEPHPDETLSVAQVLKVSSNIGADQIGMKLGPSRFDYWVHRFGFGAPTGVDLPGEESGIVLHADQYSGSSMGNLPMGQGESVTPIQMATAYSAIANGGILRPPHIVGSIGGTPVRIPAGRRVIAPSTAAELRDMLRGVLADGGTASGAAIQGWDLAGKTGTANVVVNGKYSSNDYIASFIGMVPASAPKLVVAVIVDEPHGAIYGGRVAAPAFQKIVGWAVPYFGIPTR
jgi:cell division protein FtsI/penicillin-binding protein 2